MRIYDSKALVELFDQMAQEPDTQDKGRVVDLTKCNTDEERQRIVDIYCNKQGIQYRKPKFVS